MSDGKPLSDSETPSDEEIEAAAARLSAKWGSPAPKAEQAEQTAPAERPAKTQRTESAGPILQTLEKGRTHMVTVQVRKSRRRGTNGTADKRD